MTITVKMTPPPTGTGVSGYRGQDDESRRFLRTWGMESVPENYLPALIRAVNWHANTLAILPERDTKPPLPECTEF